MSNVDLVSKLFVLFTLIAFVPQTDVLLGKTRDFRTFQKGYLGLPIIIIESILKKFFSYMRLIFALHIKLFYIFLWQYEVLIFWILDTYFFCKLTVKLFSLVLFYPPWLNRCYQINDPHDFLNEVRISVINIFKIMVILKI